MDLIGLVKYINDVLNIRRNDKDHIANILTIDSKSKNDSTLDDYSIYGFFKSVVMVFEWTRVFNITDVQSVYRGLDDPSKKSKMYFKYLDIFERSIKVYLKSNAIKYEDYIKAVVYSITISNGSGNLVYDKPRESILGTYDDKLKLFVDYPWLATLYILANTDLYNILAIDLVLELASIPPREAQ